METEYERSRIEKAKRTLDSSDPNALRGSRPPELTPVNVNVSTDWEDATIEKHGPSAVPTRATVGFLKLLVYVAVLLAVFSVIYLLYQFFDDTKRPSGNNIQIAFEIPVGVTPGIPADINVRVANYNSVPVDYAKISVLFPAGTLSGDGVAKSLVETDKVIGSIAPGQVTEYKMKVIFLGKEGEEKNLRASLEYRFAGMSSSFTKTGERATRMLASPINLTLSVLKEVNSGQVLELTLRGVSNTVIPVGNLLAKVNYPIGFTFVSADPKPVFGNNVWRVDELARGAKFTIKIKGILVGDAMQERVFQTSLGEGGVGSMSLDIVNEYNKLVTPVTVKQPFIGIALMINGRSAEDASATYDRGIEGQIDWKNNLPDRVTNATIELRLKGVSLNRPTVDARGGYFRSIDDTIIWDERTLPDLAILDSGKSGQLKFSFEALPPVVGNQLITNPVITAEVTVSGKRMSESGVPEKINVVSTQDVKVNSLAQFAGRAVYYVGPFTNTGPIPPKAEQETTFTIIWSISNTSNTITKARVTGILPPYVSWFGSVSPSGENITYDKNTNQVTWLPGDIPPGAGLVNPHREIAFQVVLLPSISQKDLVPPLVQDLEFSALDTYTGEELGGKSTDITTSLATDPKATRGSGVIRL